MSKTDTKDKETFDWYAIWFLALPFVTMLFTGFFLSSSDESLHTVYSRICLSTGEERSKLIQSLFVIHDTKTKVDWCDLAAQEKVAFFTKWATFAAWIVAFLTFVGLVYIVKTFQEARATTKAAIENVEVTTKLGQYELRAYPSFDAEYAGDETFKFKCIIKNQGKTNSIINKLNCKVTAMNEADSEKLFSSMFKSNVSGVIEIGDIEQNVTFFDNETILDRIPEIIESEKGQKIWFFLEIECYHEDIFGKSRKTFTKLKLDFSYLPHVATPSPPDIDHTFETPQHDLKAHKLRMIRLRLLPITKEILSLKTVEI